MRKIELNLTLKDKKLIQWLEMLKGMDIEPSPYVVLALEYYINTGNYLPLGSVDKAMEPAEKLRKTFYIPNHSVVETWASELIKRKKGLLSTQVRYILSNCIDSSEKGDIRPYAELIMIADDAKPAIKQEIVKEAVREEIKVVRKEPILPIYEDDEIDDEVSEDDARQRALETMYKALLPDADEY